MPEMNDRWKQIVGLMLVGELVASLLSGDQPIPVVLGDVAGFGVELAIRSRG
jgi:hypothetical protein